MAGVGLGGRIHSGVEVRPSKSTLGEMEAWTKIVSYLCTEDMTANSADTARHELRYHFQMTSVLLIRWC